MLKEKDIIPESAPNQPAQMSSQNSATHTALLLNNQTLQKSAGKPTLRNKNELMGSEAGFNGPKSESQKSREASEGLPADMHQERTSEH